MCVNDLTRVVIRCENFHSRKSVFDLESRREQPGIKISSNGNGNGIGNWHTGMGGSGNKNPIPVDLQQKVSRRDTA